MKRAPLIVALALGFFAVFLPASLATHTVSNICFGDSVTIRGTDGVDNPLNGTSAKDVMAAGDGADSIYPMAGADKACGDGDNDFIDGGNGDDSLAGANGGDGVLGNGDDDTVNGGSSNHPATDNVDGQGGNDDVNGGGGDDGVYGGGGNDHLSDGTGTDFIDGGAGYDVLDHCTPNEGDDWINVEAVNSGPGFC